MSLDLRAFGLAGSEYDETIADAETSIRRSPEERVAMFRSIQRLVAATWAHLGREEVLRRLAIGEALDRPPDPWWRDVKPQALP